MKRPLFDEVGDEIAAVLPVIQKQNPKANGFELLQRTYDHVVAGRQPQDLEARVAAEVEKRMSALKAEAEKAEKAATSVQTTVSGKDPEPETPANGMGRAVTTDDVRAAWNQLQQGSGRI